MFRFIFTGILFSLLIIFPFSLFSESFVTSSATAEGYEGLSSNPAAINFHGYNLIAAEGEYGSQGTYSSGIYFSDNFGLLYSSGGGVPVYNFLFGASFPLTDGFFIGYGVEMNLQEVNPSNMSFKFGILFFPFNFLSIGAYQKNITDQANSTFTAGIGIRPLAAFYPLADRLTLFADAEIPLDLSDLSGLTKRFQEGSLLNNLNYSLGIIAEPLNGVKFELKTFNGFSDFKASLELTLENLNIGFSFKSDLNLSDISFGTGIRYSVLPVHSILNPPVKRYKLELKRPLNKNSINKESIYNIDSLISRIYELADDPACRIIYMDFDSVTVTSIDVLEEISDAFSYFKKKGKKIITYMNNSFSQLDYLAAASGTEVIVSPANFIYLTGVGGNFLFFKKLFDKERISVDYSRSSSYKSALDQFIREKLSKENREQYSAYLKTGYNLFKKILISRGFTDKEAVKLIDNGPYNARQAEKLKLIDGRMYYDEFKDKYLKDNNPAELKIITYQDNSWENKPVIAVLKASGPVVSSETLSPMDYFFGNSYITEKNMIPVLDMIKEDKDIKGLILQIDSPGGSGFISDRIWRAIMSLRKEKPVVVVMGKVAASGGYYIAMAGDYIFARKTTLTGSIGAFTYKYVIDKFLNKYGITTDSIYFGKNFNIFSPLSRLTEEQKKKVKNLTDDFVNQFYRKVAESRHISFKTVKKIGGGRIYSGEKALKLGLIDKIGGMHEAEKYLAKRLKLHEGSYTVEYYPDRKMLFTMLIGEMKDNNTNLGTVFNRLLFYQFYR